MKCLAIFLVVLGIAGVVRGMPTNNTEIVAVPATTRPVIDGKLDDWDLSGTIFSCADTDAFLKIAAVRSAAMWDAEGIYISCRWVDPTPLENLVDPDEPGKADRGWASDCLQIRLLTDTEVHITAWLYKTGNKPAMHVHIGSLNQKSKHPEFAKGLESGAKMAFAKDADGKGYMQEIFLPWKMLSDKGKVYEAGESFKFGLHFNWGGGDNKSWRALEWQDVVSSSTANRQFFWQDQSAWGKMRLSDKGGLKLEQRPWEKMSRGPDLTTYGPAEMRYELPGDGNVTIVIEDASGKRVRNLIGAFPRKAGANIDRWDGLDDRGQPVAAGEYCWRGIYVPPIDIRYKLHTFPVGNPPWRNADSTGGWGADHSPPTYVCAENEKVYLLYGGAEGGSALVCCDLNGKKIWGQGGVLQGGGEVCAVRGKDLYYANRDKLTHVDTATGKALPFASGVENLPTGMNKSPTGMAVADGKLFLSWPRDFNRAKGKEPATKPDDVVRVIDLKTDKLVKDIAVDQPMGLAIAANGKLLAVSGNQVVAIDVESGESEVVIGEGLEKPNGIAIGTDGTIHVVNGASNQVFTFNADGKKKIRETGIAGGRPLVGKWEKEGMLFPSGVGVDKNGDLWVCETDCVARRLSKWSADGKNIAEFLGPTTYGGDGIVDHVDRSRIYVTGLELHADWETGKTYPAAIHLRGPEVGQPAVVATMVRGGFWFNEGFTTTYNGHDYFCWDRGLICIKRGDMWMPAACIGGVKKAGDGLLWSDRNGDGKVQDDEVVTLPKGKDGYRMSAGGGWGTPWSRADLSTVRMGRGTTIARFAPHGFTDDGVPIFDEESISTKELPVIGINGAPVDAAANVLVSYYEDSHAPPVQQLRFHPLGDMSGIKAYDREGKLLWTYPQPFSGVHGSFKAPLPSMPGQIIGTIYMMGTADMGKDVGTVICFNGYYGQRFLMTSDGLYVGALFKDGRTLPALPEKAEKGMLMNEMSPGAEAYGGTFSRNANGEVYLTGGFNGPMCVVMGIEGLDRIKRMDRATIKLTDEMAKAGLAERNKRNAENATANGAKVMRLMRATRKMDGDLTEWNLEKDGVLIKADETHAARVALAHDDQFLYAAYRVTGAKWKNGGNDHKVQFKNGDSVDIQLGFDAKADANRVNPVNGDVRINIAPQEGKETVMLYQASVAGHKGPRVPFISPVGKVDLDRVEEIKDAQVVVKTDGAGYSAEISIPLSAIGATLSAGMVLRGDVGVLYADELGSECVRRSYWSNQDTNMTKDLPTEIRFQVKEWGEVRVE